MASQMDNPKENGPDRGKKVRVDFRRKRNQPRRDKNWTQKYVEGQLEETPQRETLIPKGEMSRKRTIKAGDQQFDGLPTGRVIAMRGLIAEVDDGQQVWPCTIRRILRTLRIRDRHPVAVGDVVTFSIEADEPGLEKSGVIIQVQPRRSRLVRRYADRVQVIAANVDRVVIVASVAEPPLKPHLIDRYLVAAHAGNIEPVICINKVDLSDDQFAGDMAEMYRRIGYTVILACALRGVGVEELAACLPGKTTVFAGQSGVGKSSLLNALQPELKLATAVVSESTSKGRHTTTTAVLHRLPSSGYVVDTPGVRSYELADVDAHEYEMHFVEFQPYIPNCKFPNCLHTHEEGCAVKAAVETGAIDPRRYESYVRLYEEGLS
ncbi:MAG: Small ribosomal subunit biogenesis GTPase RsgA [Phycisphaerae bacterium]|nr:Small ribosomal subunit biogenesis GTPase RsgA [Phycisphaerae bacterium]